MQAATSLTLIQRVGEADDRAWHDFVHIYFPLIYSWCQSAGQSSHDAADTVQEVLRAVARDIDSYKSSGSGGFRRWLRGITRHKLHDAWRRSQTMASLDFEPADQAAGASGFDLEPEDDSSSRTDLSIAIRGALDVIKQQVEPSTWQAGWRVLVDDQPVADVADELGMTRNAVYKAKARLTRYIRQALGELIGDDSDGEK